MFARLGLVALGLVLVPASGCRSTQRAPNPLGSGRDVPAAERTISPEASEALLVRHSDPVLLRRAGSSAAFYRKRERLRPGSWVHTGSGGRAELVWPGVASSLVLFDDGAVVLGDRAHDEPLVRMRSITRARLILTPEDRVELLGGAVLRGDPTEPSGPFVVERRGPTLLRVLNQSKLDARIYFREDVLELRSGDTIHLPVLGMGSVPSPPDPDRVALEAGGFDLQILGRIEPEAADGMVRLRAEEQGEASALGVRIVLNPGEQAVLSSLGRGRVTGGTTVPEEPAPQDGN